MFARPFGSVEQHHKDVHRIVIQVTVEIGLFRIEQDPAHIAPRTAYAWLAVATALFPGLFLISVEWVRGHEVELRSFVWAAVFLPLAVGLAGWAWVGVIGESAVPPGWQFGPIDPATRTIHPGALLSVLLLVLALPAMSRARRRRKPLSPPPTA